MALVWLDSFLHNRSFHVFQKPFLSQSLLLSQGVPQGCSLSPMLFNVYVRPLADIIERHEFSIVTYANDMQLIFLSLMRIQTHLPLYVIVFWRCWMDTNCLKLNAKKTEVLVLGRQPIFGLRHGDLTTWGTSLFPH